MTKHKILLTQWTAEEFVRSAQKVLDECSLESSVNTLWGTKATGTLRRASMDLTRALAEMRKP